MNDQDIENALQFADKDQLLAAVAQRFPHFVFGGIYHDEGNESRFRFILEGGMVENRGIIETLRDQHLFMMHQSRQQGGI